MSKGPDSSSPLAASQDSFDADLRQAMLLALGLRDPAREAVFDGLTVCAAALCSCPVAGLSVMDGQQRWFKSLHGPSAQALLGDGLLPQAWLHRADWLEVSDLANDPRFSSIWAERQDLRYFAGLPLRLEGLVIGELCVGDTQRRPLMSADARAGLMGLRAAIEALLATRRPGAEFEVRSHQRRRDLLSRMSHEMRTPLNAVQGFAQLLQLHADISQSHQLVGWVSAIEKASGELLHLVEEMLALADADSAPSDHRPLASLWDEADPPPIRQ